MSAFGAWLVNRRVARVALIALCFPLGLLGVVSAAVVAMTAIRRGWREAGADCLMAGLVLVGFAALAGGNVQPLLLSAAVSWGMALGLGAVTGAYASLNLSVQALLLLGVAGIVVFELAVGDPAGYWTRVLGDFAAELEAVGFPVADPGALQPLAPAMTGLVATSVVLTSIAALLLGAWWASGGGAPALGPMFVRLRLGYVIGGLAALAGIGAVLSSGSLVQGVLLVLGAGFMLQGLAVVHWHARARGWGWPVMLLVYLPLLMGAAVGGVAALLLAAAGFVDNWYGLRRYGADVV